MVLTPLASGQKKCKRMFMQLYKEDAVLRQEYVECRCSQECSEFCVLCLRREITSGVDPGPGQPDVVHPPSCQSERTHTQGSHELTSSNAFCQSRLPSRTPKDIFFCNQTRHCLIQRRRPSRAFRVAIRYAPSHCQTPATAALFLDSLAPTS